MSKAEQRQAARAEGVSQADLVTEVSVKRPVIVDGRAVLEGIAAEEASDADGETGDGALPELELLVEEHTAVMRPGSVDRRALPFKKSGERRHKADEEAAAGAPETSPPAGDEAQPASVWSAAPTVDPNALPSALAPPSMPPPSMAPPAEEEHNAVWIVLALLAALVLGFVAVIVLARM
jgi:hypothetical protein